MVEDFVNLRLPKKRYVIAEAGLWRRLLAIGIDILLLDLVVFSPFTSFFQERFPGSIIEDMALAQGFSGDVLFVFIMVSILALSYFALFQYYFLQTVGMLVMKIKVEGELSFGKSIMRSIIALPFFPFFLLWLIEPVLIVAKKGALLERLTQTRTVLRLEV